ncbi:MAG: tRNA pseudouridine(38-40) synthase TruA [Phycisphaerae bacterium]|nr:tRNA pseudouridine(38-40) synthase TruA [Phycisphaerae bacterium]
MSESEPSRNVKLVISYDGRRYHGWQRQAPGVETVQERLEHAAMRVLHHPVTVHGAGRTDAGVHAEGQVANLHTTNLAVPLSGMRRAMNARLPSDIVIRSITPAAAEFHASRSAVGKTYRYRLYTGPQRPVEQARRVWWYWRPLDAERMSDAAERLVGRHDFRGLASSAEDRETTVRTIFRCDVSRQEDEIHVAVTGDGFLYNMVRNIVGTLAEIGRGHWPAERVENILASRDRRDAGPTAPPDGLSMVCVYYDPADLPSVR